MIDVVLVQRSLFDTDPAFPLEDGPIAPVDPATFVVTMPRPALVDLVGGASGELAGHHAAIDTAQQAIVATSDPAAFRAASGAIDEGAGAHAAHGGAFDQADPVSVIQTTGGKGAEAGARRSDYNETPPPEQPVHDPGPPPRGGDGDDRGRV
jgi:hypothetical protein